MQNVYEVELECCDENYEWSHLYVSVMADGELEAVFLAGQRVTEVEGVRAVSVKLKQDNNIYREALARSFDG